MKTLLFGTKYKEENKPYIEEVIKCLQGGGAQVSIYGPYADEIEGRVELDHLMRIESKNDLVNHGIGTVISLGGDGTILSAATLIQDKKTPVLGINLGRLGFLAIVEKRYIELAIDKLLNGKYTIEDRAMLSIDDRIDIFGECNFALNDITLHKRDTSSMISVEAKINGQYLKTYWADGIIVSTPTGSTGYSLSCGGPIIFPGSGCLVITPVAPHNLNSRPIVLPDNVEISFKLEGRTENFLCTLDSRFETITGDEDVIIKKANYPTRLIKLHGTTFLKTIHNKLLWGIDARN